MKSHKSFFFRTVLIATAFLTIQSFAQAQAQNLIASTDAANKVQFVGMQGDMLIFDLQLNNLPSKGSWIRIMDGKKNILFEHRTNSATYLKRFKIVRENLSNIHFEVISKEIILKESFQLNYKVEEKMEVIKA